MVNQLKTFTQISISMVNRQKLERLKREDEVKRRLQQSKTMIISSGSKKRKFYDKHGNEVKDPETISLIRQGMTLVRFSEVVEEGAKDVHVLRRRK
jgi:hypothetical protein